MSVFEISSFDYNQTWQGSTGVLNVERGNTRGLNVEEHLRPEQKTNFKRRIITCASLFDINTPYTELTLAHKKLSMVPRALLFLPETNTTTTCFKHTAELIWVPFYFSPWVSLH